MVLRKTVYLVAILIETMLNKQATCFLSVILGRKPGVAGSFQFIQKTRMLTAVFLLSCSA